MPDARLIVDSPAAGAWNMAVDQALLQSANDSRQMTLRFYQWSQPTLSLGYFQKAAERQAHAPSLNCSLVRRSSGGGAILHDRELTYSICVPDDNRLSSASTELYDLVHQQIIELLAERGIEASLATGCGRGVAKGCSFLCFERLTDGDVVIGRNKICGSAQRRMKHAVVQHGSLLLNQSECAPELPGVQELTGQALEISDVVAGLTERISGALGLRLSAGQLTPEEIAAAKDIERQRFAADGWTLRR